MILQKYACTHGGVSVTNNVNFGHPCTLLFLLLLLHLLFSHFQCNVITTLTPVKPQMKSMPDYDVYLKNNEICIGLASSTSRYYSAPGSFVIHSKGMVSEQRVLGGGALAIFLWG